MTAEHFRNVLIGGILITGSILTASYTLNESNHWMHLQNQSVKTKAEIIAIYPYSAGIGSNRSTARVQYTIDDIEYRSNLASCSDDMRIGQEIYVYCEKEHPERTISRPEYLNILYIIAAVQLLIGILVLIIDPE